jgi:hypothetical protein
MFPTSCQITGGVGIHTNIFITMDKAIKVTAKATSKRTHQKKANSLTFTTKLFKADPTPCR